MRRHADIIRPKFKAVLDAFEKELAPCGIADWTNPNGGYFISLNTMEGCAKRVYKLCLEAGVKLTEAGATFPYGRDPHDKNLRIAPTYPPVSELETAVEVLVVCVKIAAIEKLLNQ
jgi:DNA-binding transcriptional MocR family regulator